MTASRTSSGVSASASALDTLWSRRRYSASAASGGAGKPCSRTGDSSPEFVAQRLDLAALEPLEHCRHGARELQRVERLRQVADGTELVCAQQVGRGRPRGEEDDRDGS